MYRDIYKVVGSGWMRKAKDPANREVYVQQ